VQNYCGCFCLPLNIKGLFVMIFSLMSIRINIRSKVLHSVVVIAMLFTFMLGAIHHHADARSHSQDCVTCVSVAHSPALISDVSAQLRLDLDFVASTQLEREAVDSTFALIGSAPRAPPAV